MNKKFLQSLVIITVFIISLFFLVSNNSSVHNFSDIRGVSIAGQNIKVDLALTIEQQTQGLSGRNGLKENEGMLFIFDHPDKYLFWMKDMKFSIDIIWISEDMKIIYIKKDARPELYPETYGPASSSQGGPNENAKYVLETASGFSEKNNLQIGDRVLFTY